MRPLKMLHPCVGKHLKDRKVPTNVRVFYNEETAVWLCYNLSGQLTGFQEYNPNRPKEKRNVGKYKTNGYGMFGLEHLDYNQENLYVCEGFFEACMFLSLGLNAVAVFGNDPKQHKEQLALLPFKKIAALDNDKASEKLLEYTSSYVRPPSNYKDFNDMALQDFKEYLNNEAN